LNSKGEKMSVTVSSVYQLPNTHLSYKMKYDKANKEFDKQRRLCDKRRTYLDSLSDDELSQDEKDEYEEMLAELKILEQQKEAELVLYKEKLIFLGSGTASRKKDAEKKAAEQGIKKANAMGLYKKSKTFFLVSDN